MEVTSPSLPTRPTNPGLSEAKSPDRWLENLPGPLALAPHEDPLKVRPPLPFHPSGLTLADLQLPKPRGTDESPRTREAGPESVGLDQLLRPRPRSGASRRSDPLIRLFPRRCSTPLPSGRSSCRKYPCAGTPPVGCVGVGRCDPKRHRIGPESRSPAHTRVRPPLPRRAFMETPGDAGNPHQDPVAALL